MTLARPTGGGPAPVLRPGVTFETKCYERDWRELLLTDRLSRAIAQHRFPFAERILYVNNVERPELVLRHARRLVDEGVLTDCVLVDEHSEEALLFFGLTEEDFQGGYRYSIAELVALYRCRTEYLLHYAGDCMLEEPTDWLRPCLERMRLQRSIVAANPVPNGRMDEAAREALLTDGDFHLGYGFSDQCYLVRTLDFRARIYGERHPASERYPAYGGELFEKRVDAWMRVSGFMRLTWRRGSYWHRTLRSSEPELDLSAPALACYRAGAKAMEELDYESASVWLRLAELAVSCERQLGRRLDPDLRWLPRLQLAVCDDRLGRPELAWLSNEAAAVHAPPGQRSIEANREMMAERMSGGGSEQPLLSVLIPSLPERSASLSVLLERLRAQAHGRPVELLALTDNRLRTTGAKRNALLELAQGKFVAFVDDDDRIADGYAERLLAAIRSEPDADCIVFDVRVHADGSPSRLCRYGIELDHGSDAEGYTRKPNHLMAYRRELALRHRYLDIGYGEDDEWAARASADIVVQHRIEAVLYEYDWAPKPLSWYGAARSPS